MCYVHSRATAVSRFTVIELSSPPSVDVRKKDSKLGKSWIALHPLRRNMSLGAMHSNSRICLSGSKASLEWFDALWRWSLVFSVLASSHTLALIWKLCQGLRPTRLMLAWPVPYGGCMPLVHTENSEKIGCIRVVLSDFSRVVLSDFSATRVVLNDFSVTSEEEEKPQ